MARFFPGQWVRCVNPMATPPLAYRERYMVREVAEAIDCDCGADHAGLLFLGVEPEKPGMYYGACAFAPTTPPKAH